eukprot:GHVP01004855.1.p1 GENE.GHVP01004855.1~~GHVP01004855.1.p1  ORF type:complete len:175 (-),score=14.28 GHVP01004855.1:234-758(-)
MSNPPETDISAIAASHQLKDQNGVAAVFLVLGLLIGACFKFQGTWSQTCDYDVKVWVVVDLSFLLLCKIRNFVPSVEEKTPQGLLLFIFFCWCIYGIKPCLVDSNCAGVADSSMVGTNWGLGIWCFQFACLVIICFGLLVALEMQRAQSSASEPRNNLLVIFTCFIMAIFLLLF